MCVPTYMYLHVIVASGFCVGGTFLKFFIVYSNTLSEQPCSIHVDGADVLYIVHVHEEAFTIRT